MKTALFLTKSKEFREKSEMLRRGQPLSYTEQFLFVLSFNVAPYLQLKRNLIFFI